MRKKRSDITATLSGEPVVLLKTNGNRKQGSAVEGYPLVVKSAKGAIVEDVDGNRFLDFCAGIAVTATGHCHPHVVRAIQKQSELQSGLSGGRTGNGSVARRGIHRQRGAAW